MEKVEAIANALDLRGCASVDAFIDAADGSLYIIEVNTVPSLAPGCLMFQQALEESPPMYPDDFLRRQLILALTPTQAEAQSDDAADYELRMGEDEFGDGNEFAGDEFDDAGLYEGLGPGSASGGGDVGTGGMGALSNNPQDSFLGDELDWAEQ